MDKTRQLIRETYFAAVDELDESVPGVWQELSTKYQDFRLKMERITTKVFDAYESMHIASERETIISITEYERLLHGSRMFDKIVEKEYLAPDDLGDVEYMLAKDDGLIV